MSDTEQVLASSQSVTYCQQCKWCGVSLGMVTYFGGGPMPEPAICAECRRAKKQVEHLATLIIDALKGAQ